MDFGYLCNQYELGWVQNVKPLKPGTASRVWRMETDSGVFLLRTLSGREQGEREWSVFSHLRKRAFNCVPAIIPTQSGAPCLEVDGLWYQVQEFVTGVMPDPAEAQMAAKLARLAKGFAGALTDYPFGPVIHGDFGPWNILRREDGQLLVIDLGEARTGDPYFDYASLLGGVINHTPTEMRESVCREFVRELDCDRTRLLDQLRCWAEQGIREWTGRNEKMIARFNHALNWAEEHLYDL